MTLSGVAGSTLFDRQETAIQQYNDDDDDVNDRYYAGSDHSGKRNVTVWCPSVCPSV